MSENQQVTPESVTSEPEQVTPESVTAMLHERARRNGTTFVIEYASYHPERES